MTQLFILIISILAMFAVIYLGGSPEQMNLAGIYIILIGIYREIYKP
jgi:hypothetical protein